MVFAVSCFRERERAVAIRINNKESIRWCHLEYFKIKFSSDSSGAIHPQNKNIIDYILYYHYMIMGGGRRQQFKK